MPLSRFSKKKCLNRKSIREKNMRLFGPPNIEKLEVKQNVEGLIKALRNKKYTDARWQSARILEQIRDKRAVEPIIEALSNDHG
jgi:HEAT repeat protein